MILKQSQNPHSVLNNPIVNTCPHGSSPPRMITHKKCPSFICFNAAGCNSRAVQRMYLPVSVQTTVAQNYPAHGHHQCWTIIEKSTISRSIPPPTPSSHHPHFRGARTINGITRCNSPTPLLEAHQRETLLMLLSLSISNTKLHHHGLAVEIVARRNGKILNRKMMKIRTIEINKN